MDYKKKYEGLIDALRKAKDDNALCDERYCCVIDEIVPELKESEDEKIRNLIYCLIRDRSDNGKLLEANGCSIEKALAWLEKQGEKGAKGNEREIPFSEQKPVEWSEEDSSKIQRICHYLNEAKEYYPDLTEIRECIVWLESLKEKLSNIEKIGKNWKPSEEQIEALATDVKTWENSLKGTGLVGTSLPILKELLEQLKAL